MSEKNSRWDEIRKIQIESASAYHIFGAVLLVLFGVWLGSRLFASDSGFGSNLFAELLGIFVTVFIIDYLHRRRDEKRRTKDLKENLLREVHSPVASIAKNAIHELGVNGWTTGENGVLRELFLPHSKLEGVDLKLANLSNSYLYGSDLSKSNLAGANMDNSNLQNTNLANCYLSGTKLRNVDLENADLRNAVLTAIDLRGANLRNANLDNAPVFTSTSVLNSDTLEFEDQSHSKEYQTILPDGSLAKASTDMSRFTDPENPEFWTSKDLESPAHPDNDVFRRWFKSIPRFLEP